MNVCIVRLVFWLVSSEHCRGPPLNLWALQGPTIECMKDWSRYSTHCTQCHLNSTKISYLWILRIQDKTIVTTHRVCQSKFSVDKLMNQTVSNSNLESTLTQTKLLTDRSNDEASITIQLRNIHGNHVIKNPEFLLTGILQVFPCPVRVQQQQASVQELWQDICNSRFQQFQLICV